MRHLGDDQLQDYLDGNFTSADRALVRAHIISCSSCRLRLQRYEALYHGLGEDSGYELSEGFAARVADAATVPESSLSWPVAVAVWSLAAVALAALLWWPVGLSSLWSGWLRLVESQTEMFTYLRSGVGSLLVRLGHEGQVLGIGLAVLLTYVVIDRMLLLARRGRVLLTI